MSLSAAFTAADHAYNMNEASGNRSDGVAGATLTDTNTVGSASGKFGNAAVFISANSESLIGASDSTFKVDDEDWSISFWWKSPSSLAASNQLLLARRQSNGNINYAVTYQQAFNRLTGTFGFVTVGSSLTISTSTWYFISLIHDATNDVIKLRVNATTDSDSDAGHDTLFPITTAAFIIGDDGLTSQYLDGTIDDLVWMKGYVFSDQDHVDAYNSGTGVAFASWNSGPTVPTLSSPTVPTGGVTLTATLSQSGCIPTSGTGGFTLAGTSATVASWAISGTTLTLTLSGTVYSGQTVTYSYDRATTTDDISESTAVAFLANFSGTSVTNSSTQTQPLTSGTASFVSSGTAGIVITCSATSGGTPSYTYLWKRNDNGGSYSSMSNGGGVSGATTQTVTDGSAVAGHLYGYKLDQVDSAGSPATVTSNVITAQVYNGGALTGGGLLVSSGMTGGFQTT